MNRSRLISLICAVTAVFIVMGSGERRSSAQSVAPADLRAALEGTWQLEEWHVGGQVLRPPQADGRWSNRDGVVLFVLNRTDTGDSNMGYGVYEITSDTWGYRYHRMQSTSGPLGGPLKINVAKPEPTMRSFKIRREPGKVVLEGANDDRREYEGPFFTFLQKGQIIRKWRRTS